MMRTLLHRSVGIVALVLAFGTLGCVMPDQLSQVQKDLADVQEQLARIEREQAEAREAIADVKGQGGRQENVSRQEFADLDVRVDQAARNVEITDERLKDLARQVDRLAGDVEATRAATTTPSGLPQVVVTDGRSMDAGSAVPVRGSATDGNPDELYNTAYADFSKGNYALAVAGFEEFYETYGSSAVADNALYWIGECHFSQGDFSAAVQAFDRLLESFPESDKAAAANLKKGLAYLEQNQVRQAIVQLQHVRSTYPGTDEAKVARDKLSSLGAPT